MSAPQAATETKTEVPVVTNISNSDVVLKYKAASTITQDALKAVVEKAVAGAKIIDLCTTGDEIILSAMSKVYKGKKVSKGIAFPTCVSLNHICCHVSPLSTDPEANVELKKGDLVKIELGSHIDGYPSVLGHSFVVGATKDEPATGKAADVIQAAYHSVEAAYRLIRPGNKNFLVTDTVQKICESFGTVPAEGTLAYNLEKDVLEGDKQIIFNPNEMQRKGFKSCEFAVNEVYCVAAYVSSGEGKLKETNIRTTVFKRTDSTYELKMKAARSIKNEIKQFGRFPFSLRSLSDEKSARMGIVECSRSGVVTNFDVTSDKPEEFIASFMYTVMVHPTGNVIGCSFPVDLESYKSEKKIEDAELLEVLQKDVLRKPKAKKTSA